MFIVEFFMSRFSLELLPENEDSMRQLKGRAVALAHNLRGLNGEDRVYFLKEISEPCSWAILQYIEGTGLEREKREEVLSFTENHISEKLIQEAFTVAVNGAMLHRRTGSPGYRHGHNILWRDIATNRNSIFYDAITPEFQNRLNNGRFWEELGNLSSVNMGSSYAGFEDLLVFHHSDLDTSFVPRGLRIHEENGGSIHLQLNQYKRISERGLTQYRNFIHQIDQKLGDLGIDRTRFEPLVKAYLDAVAGDYAPKEHSLTLGQELEENPWLREYEHLVSRVEAA